MSAGLAAAAVPGAGARPTTLALLLENRPAVIGLALLSLVGLLALLAPLLPIPDPDATAPARRLLRPFSAGHPLGTDHLGRDLLSRLLWGTRVSVAVGISATLVAALVGSLIGLVAGYAGGRVDGLLMRGIDMLMAFPYILLALAIVAVLGPGLMNALFAIAVANIPFFARNIRGVTLGLARSPFVDAARLSGKSHPRILFTEVLPNALPVIVITMSTTVGWMILETAGLSFLGLGAQPPQADLGSMLGEGRGLLFTAPHVSVIPGLMIFALVMSINLLGDGVRDMLDPRLRAGSAGRPSAATRVDRRTTPPMPEALPRTTLSVLDLRTELVLGREVLPAAGGVSFELRAGECLGLVGESGSGKSVVALSLMRLVPTPPGRIVGGRVVLAGEDLLEADPERLRRLRGNRIAQIFQDPLASLHPLYTVGEQLVEAIRAHRPVDHRVAWAQAVALLDRVRIPNPARRARAHPHELSGGMRQRVCIAMALANDPGILIADEPTTALDVTVQARVLRRLHELREERGTAVLFITHDFGLVAAVCDRVAVVYAGRIVETGPAREVLASPAHPYTRGLIDCIPASSGSSGGFDTITGRPPSLAHLPAGCAFAPRCPRARDACREAEVALEPVHGERQVRCRFPLTEAG